jgi:hypothetical protein
MLCMPPPALKNNCKDLNRVGSSPFVSLWMEFIIRANAIDKPAIKCYYIAVVSDTEYKSYRIARGDCAGKPNGNAKRRA